MKAFLNVLVRYSPIHSFKRVESLKLAITRYCVIVAGKWFKKDLELSVSLPVDFKSSCTMLILDYICQLAKFNDLMSYVWKVYSNIPNIYDLMRNISKVKYHKNGTWFFSGITKYLTAVHMVHFEKLLFCCGGNL